MRVLVVFRIKIPLKHPQMMTYETIHKLHIVKMLLKRVDSLTPKVKMASAKISETATHLQLKECGKITGMKL